MVWRLSRRATGGATETRPLVDPTDPAIANRPKSGAAGRRHDIDHAVASGLPATICQA
jgi:hypothetical protein